MSQRLRLRPSWKGLWVQRSGNARLHAWRSLLPIVLLPPTLLLALLLAVNRQSWYLAQALHSRAGLSYAWEDFSTHVAAAGDNLLRTGPVPHQSPLTTVELTVEERALELLERAIHRGDTKLKHEPGGDRPYVRGKCKIDRGRVSECQIAYRGHKWSHHWSVKPSLRVKLPRKSVRLGRRYLELQRPEDLPLLTNLLPEAIGRKLGLLTSHGEPARLFINARYKGVYLLSARPGDPLAREMGALPGVFLKGDNLTKRGQPHVPGALWTSSGAWRVTGDNPQTAIAQLEVVQALVRSKQQTPADIVALTGALDVEAYAKWSALQALVSGLNTEGEHNYVLFWNRYRGRLEPLGWDMNGYWKGRTLLAVNIATDPISALLQRDPRWVHRRDMALHALILAPNAPGSVAAQHAWIDAHMARVARDLRADRSGGELEGATIRFRTLSVRELDDRVDRVKRWIESRERYLKTFLGLARVHLSTDPKRPTATRVQVAGAVAVRVDLGAGRTRLLYPGLGPGLSRFPVPRTYTIDAPSTSLRFRNAVTGGPVQRLTRPAPAKPSISFPEGAFPPPKRGTVTLGPGVVRLTEDLVIGPSQRLVIAAGTTIELGPRVSIYARGRVTAKGTSTAPIRFKPLDPSRPWGCLGLLGSGCAGSVLQHAQLSGGSVGSHRGAHFSGMLSAYGVGHVTLQSCYFGAHSEGDDAVNLAQSEVRIVDCTWEGTRADGLDLDRCRGVVQGCRFLRCGNDGLDLMSCVLRIDDLTATACRDKGISVGEGTRVLVRRARIEGCNFGAEVKDASVLLLEDCRITGNGVGVHAYPKKWSYGQGGAVALTRTPLRKNRLADISLEARSLALLIESPVGAPGVGPASLKTLEALPARWAALRKRLESLGAQRPD